MHAGAPHLTSLIPRRCTYACTLRAGKWMYYAAWLYCSLCMAIFLVRTLKRIIFQEARNYGA